MDMGIGTRMWVQKKAMGGGTVMGIGMGVGAYKGMGIARGMWYS